jgi:hypothetical protein
MQNLPNNPERILNCIPSPKTETDWTFNDAVTINVVTAGAPLPASVDLREDWWTINDQGRTGSCVGWATADGVLRWHYVKKLRITTAELPSVRFIWMSAKETDEFTSSPSTFIEASGTSLKSALDVARNYGCVKDAVLPFASCVMYPGEESAFYAIAAQLKIASYFNLIKENEDHITAWKQWLADGKGPIMIRVGVDATWDNCGADGELNAFDNGTVRGYHAVCIVGYINDRFIIRNSWGTASWGKGGFGFASYAYAKAAFAEAYGITVL